MSTTFAALWASLVRTVVPIIVGHVVGWLTAASLPIDNQFELLLGTTLSGVLTGVYYIGVRLLETYVTPKFGWLLGLAKAPVVYANEAPKTIAPAIEVATATVDIASAEAKTNDTPNV